MDCFLKQQQLKLGVSSFGKSNHFLLPDALQGDGHFLCLEKVVAGPGGGDV